MSEGCCGKCDTTAGLNRLEYEIKVALDRIDGDASGLNEVTAIYLAQQANLYRSGLRRATEILEQRFGLKERERTASRETVNG